MSAETPSSSPYVGLIPYSEAEAPFFFGRKAERDTIIENLRSTRLTLLYGASGVGKSSVLHAGVAYHLHQLTRHSLDTYGTPEFAVVVFNAWRDDPITGLMRSVQQALARALQVKSIEAVPASSNLAEMLKAWTERFGIELLIILDQFEEYFIYRPEEKAEGSFAFEFPRAVNDPELRAKFLISLRDDAVSRLDRFKSQLPNVYDNMLRLRHMNVEAAREAIEGPIEAYNEIYVKGENEAEYSIEPALVDEILKQVPARLDYSTAPGQAAPDGPPAARYIETPYLQLVMTRLWEKERADGSRVLRLITLESLKGLKNIVQVYLNDSLDKLTPDQQSDAARIFDYLVTPSGTKVAYVESDLALRTRIAPERIASVITELNKARILRSVDPPLDRPNESRWEVFHDVLARAILHWQSQYQQTFELAEAERKRQAEALAREAKQLRRWRAILIGMLLIAFALLGFAMYQRGEAIRLRKEADATKDKLAKVLAEREEQIRTAVKENPELAGTFNIVKTDEVDATQAEILPPPTRDDYNGRSRKIAKLSIPEANIEEFGDLQDLIASLPSDDVMRRLGLRNTAGTDRVAEERRNVRVRAFIHAASMGNDNDYTLIIGRRSGKGPEVFMTAAVSGLPPASSEFFPRLKSTRDAYKEFFGDNLPGRSYDFYDPPIPVEIEGALFWDSSHATGARPGPNSLKSRMPTLWEIHPVTKIVFEP